jgi:hypothetical protein
MGLPRPAGPRYAARMEDGPEELDGTYDYAGQTYRLVEETSEQWKVYREEQYLGVLLATSGPGLTGPQYTIDLAGEEGLIDEPATDDWRRALEVLIDSTAPPVGA